MARPTLYTQNTDELVRRAQANKRNDEFVAVTGLAVPNKKADREAFDAVEDHNHRQEIRSTFGLPYPIIDAAQQLVANDGRTLVRFAKVVQEIGDGVHYTSAAANGILARVERGTLDLEGFLELLKDKATGGPKATS